MEEENRAASTMPTVTMAPTIPIIPHVPLIGPLYPRLACQQAQRTIAVGQTVQAIQVAQFNHNRGFWKRPRPRRVLNGLPYLPHRTVLIPTIPAAPTVKTSRRMMRVSQTLPVPPVLVSHDSVKDSKSEAKSGSTSPTSLMRIFGKSVSEDTESRESRKRKNRKVRSFKILHITKSRANIRSTLENEMHLYSAYENAKLAKSTADKHKHHKHHKHSNASSKRYSMRDNVFIDIYTTPPIKEHVNNFCAEAKRILVEENAGAALAKNSESLSAQYFKERFAASKFLLEMEIEYWINYKLVDFVCEIYGQRVGISVTRAMKWPRPGDFTEKDAYDLLNKKLFGLTMARNGISEKHSFNVCILHVWAQTLDIAEKLKKIHPRVIAEDESDTFREVIILVSVYKDSWIYNNRDSKKPAVSFNLP